MLRPINYNTDAGTGGAGSGTPDPSKVDASKGTPPAGTPPVDTGVSTTEWDGKSDEDVLAHYSTKTVSELTAADKALLEKRGIKIEEAEADKGGDADTNTEFFKTVIGQIDNEFKDFDKYDFTNPESVKNLINDFAERDFQNWESAVEQKAPREFLALQMALEGKDPSILYNKGEVDSLVNADIKNEEVQKAVLKHFLVERGLDEDLASATVQAAYDNKTLAAKALDAQIKIKEAKTSEYQKIQQQLQEEETFKTNEINGFKRYVSGIIAKGALLGDIKLSENEKGAFNSFINQQNVEVKDGELYIYTKVEPENLTKELSALYFKYKNGDLKSIAQNIANKDKVLTLKIARDKTNSSGGSNDGKQTAKKITFK